MRGVGYVRVSSDKQVQEGVSLDAQREKITQYCALYGIELIAIYVDEGVTAKTLKRPALRTAFARLDRGDADSLIVCKLDRRTRSLQDLNVLIERYFSADRFTLLSVSESLDTRSPNGRFVLYILGIVAQWEREAISERTREALAHLRSRGVHIGPAGHGQAYAKEIDAEGHRAIVEVPEEKQVIAEILASFDSGKTALTISRELNARGIQSPRRRQWSCKTVLDLLERQGRQPRRPRPKREYQPERAQRIARELHNQERSLRFIARKLHEAGLRPRMGGRWHPTTVRTLLTHGSAPSRAGSAQKWTRGRRGAAPPDVPSMGSSVALVIE
jgi:DNA invertase Pin-like site-specific DNA recombinase